MKNPRNLQDKLQAILRGRSEPRLFFLDHTWTEQELDLAASLISHYLDCCDEVVDDPLNEWLDQYRFHRFG